MSNEASQAQIDGNSLELQLASFIHIRYYNRMYISFLTVKSVL